MNLIEKKIRHMQENHIPASALWVDRVYSEDALIRTDREVFNNCTFGEITEDGKVKIILSDGTFLWRVISHVKALFFDA